MRTVAFSPDSKLVGSGGENGKVVVWDLPTRGATGDLPAGGGLAVNDVAFSPDGRTLASAGAASVILWDVGSRRQIGAPLAGVRDVLTAVAFSPDGRWLAWGTLAVEPTRELVAIWDADETSWGKRACQLAA